MENMDLQSNLTMMENIEFEEKVNINNLLLPSKPIKLAKIEIHDIKQEPFIQICSRTLWQVIYVNFWNYQKKNLAPQCPRTDLNKRFLPRPKTTLA